MHGSKGMQYPVVFVADSNYVPKYQDVLLYNRDNLPFWYSGVENKYFEKIKEEKNNHFTWNICVFYMLLSQGQKTKFI